MKKEIYILKLYFGDHDVTYSEILGIFTKRKISEQAEWWLKTITSETHCTITIAIGDEDEHWHNGES